MKKRLILIPLSILTLSCSPTADTRNKYLTKEECLQDNPVDRDDVGEDNCEEVTYQKDRYYLGPAYPYSYHGNSGFWNGYWLGRSTGRSVGVVHSSGSYFSNSEISSGGGLTSTLNSRGVIGNASSSSAVSSGAKAGAISRGGFGSFGRASFGS